jgi:hypothetical protein
MRKTLWNIPLEKLGKIPFAIEQLNKLNDKKTVP